MFCLVFDRNNSGGGGGGADGGNSLRRPTLTRDRKIDPEIERKQIQDVLGNDDGDDDDDDEEDGATKLMAGMKGLANDSFRPIELHQQSSNYAIKNEIKIERTDPSASASVAAVEYPHSLEDFFNRTEPQLFLLQLPDSLPGHGPDMEPGESAAAEQNNKSDDPVSWPDFFSFIISLYNYIKWFSHFSLPVIVRCDSWKRD